MTKLEVLLALPLRWSRITRARVCGVSTARPRLPESSVVAEPCSSVDGVSTSELQGEWEEWSLLLPPGDQLPCEELAASESVSKSSSESEPVVSS
jgi:hypothetical protein